MAKKALPKRLYAAHEWTRAAGEIEELAGMARRARSAGTTLRRYCRQSAANARQHDEGEVTEETLLELAAWLKA